MRGYRHETDSWRSTIQPTPASIRRREADSRAYIFLARPLSLDHPKNRRILETFGLGETPQLGKPFLPLTRVYLLHEDPQVRSLLELIAEGPRRQKIEGLPRTMDGVLANPVEIEGSVPGSRRIELEFHSDRISSETRYTADRLIERGFPGAIEGNPAVVIKNLCDDVADRALEVSQGRSFPVVLSPSSVFSTYQSDARAKL